MSSLCALCQPLSLSFVDADDDYDDLDVKPISQNCTPEAIAKEISVSSPRLVMLSISISMHNMLGYYMNFSSVVLFLCYATCCFIAAFLRIKSTMISDWLTSVGYCIRHEVYKTTDERGTIISLTWSMAAVGLHIPIVNGAVSSADYRILDIKRTRPVTTALVSSNLSGRVAEQSNDHTSLLCNQ